MRHFKIKTGYNQMDYIEIDETELEKAYGVFLTDGKGVFKNGVVRGQDIIAITEDWNKAMGYNKEYVVTPEDRYYIRKDGVEKKYQGVLDKVSAKVEYLIKNNKQDLIGKNIEIPELENKEPKNQIEGSKALADKFKIE